MHWWVADYYRENPMLLGAWVFWVIASITLHELAHGWTAIKLGDDTPYHTGHMTFNPLVHMGTTALIMFALFGFTWGAMPISPHRLRGRYGEALVAFAGPACNMIQFLILITANILWIKLASGHVDDNVFLNMHTFLWAGSMINLMGFIFNLLPIPPLDGWRITADIFPRYNNLWSGERGSIIGLAVFAGMFMFGGSLIWGIVFFLNQLTLDVACALLGAPDVPAPF
jgi:Zn-dependent protease